ncbi:MAG: HlyC/CorC family transporter [Candidatus Omnitrophica bacterium]|nr:HlyC/CorC family transporter [Candidatus Omnitrophota bacterium]
MVSLLIVFALIAILISFLCSMWEAVLLSITPSYAQIKLQDGTKTGKLIEAFKQNIDRPLSAILTLNTIAHTVGAIGVGHQAAMIWEETNPFITNLVVPVVMTLAILILSEIIPKTIGANYWPELAPFTVQSLSFIITCLYPLVWVSQLITKALKKDKSRSIFSRTDFLAMAEIGVREGLFEQSESEILHNLLRFNTIQVKDVMTPRTVVKVAPEEMTLQEFYDRNKTLRFSRIPIHQGEHMEHVTGYILKDELLGKLVQDKGEERLSSIKREILVVHENFPIPEIFSRFLEKREHIALVVDEFGGMEGIVTMEDVIETLLGMEIVDEYDSTADMQALARKNWERRAKHLGLIEEKQNSEEKRKFGHDTEKE